MQLPVSDVDFYERKIFRLEKDIACLNEELSAAKLRLRSAQDFQIKYQLLLRQSQQQTLRIKKIEQVQRLRLSQIMIEQIERVNKQWIVKIQEIEKKTKQQQMTQKQTLLKKVEDLEKKNKDMIEKSDQMDALLFKNKKIAKDLQSLQQIIEQTRINNEKQREQDIKVCKQNLSKKFEEKMKKQKGNYEQIINNLEQKNEKLEIQLMKLELLNRQTIKNQQKLSRPEKHIEQNIEKALDEQIQNLKNLLKIKNDIIENLQQQKISLEQKNANYIRESKIYERELQQKLFDLQTSHQAEIFNLKKRMDEVRRQQLIQKQKQCQIIQKQHMKQNELLNQKIMKQKIDLENIKRLEQAQIAKLKQDKQKLQKKIIQLKNRLKQYETQQQAGQTINLINSLKHGDKKQDEQQSYQNGVTFLQRQLKKLNIKLQKKNLQIKDLVAKLNDSSESFEKQLSQMKHKYNGQIKDLNDKIINLQEQVKDRNHQIRQIIKDFRQKQIDYDSKLDQLNADNRSLQNLTNNLQRDYNRILQSKKLIQKSFRQERERSITSKSQIAMAKKQKWIQLQRQKNQIQIIYKQKQEQLKTNAQVVYSQLRVQNDKLKKEKQLLEQQLSILKQRMKQINNLPNQKQNIHSEYEKKLATVNLEIALTQNLYQSLIKAKSRVRKVSVQEQKGDDRSKHHKSHYSEVANKQEKTLKNQKKHDNQSLSKKSSQPPINREYDNISSDESNKIISSIGHHSQQPMYLDEDQPLQQQKSPTFMQFSFNPKFV